MPSACALEGRVEIGSGMHTEPVRAPSAASIRTARRRWTRSVVRVRDDAGRTHEYELVGRLGPEDDLSQVSLGSPVGSALLGARPGDVVRLTLPNGRERSLGVLGVRGARSTESLPA